MTEFIVCTAIYTVAGLLSVGLFAAITNLLDKDGFGILATGSLAVHVILTCVLALNYHVGIERLIVAMMLALAIRFVIYFLRLYKELNG